MDNTKALTLYPEQKEIDTLAHRVRDLLPGADKFSDAVLTAFAQISLAHGLDPFIGEIWIIPTSRGPRIRAGIEGHRKAAHKQSPYQLVQRQMTGQERDEHQLRDDQIGAVTEIYRTDSRLPSQAFQPTVGWGIYSKGDRIPHTKTGMWVAFKRSEQDALRKAFDLPFVSEENGNGPAMINGVGPEHRGVGSAPIPTPPPEPPLSATQAAADLYGDYDGEVFAPGDDDPPAEPQEEIVDPTATLISDAPPAVQPPADNGSPPLDKWGSFRNREAALTWALRQGAFKSIDHTANAYDNLKANARPKNAQQMAEHWLADIAYRLQTLKEMEEIIS